MRTLATQISRLKLQVDLLAPVHGKPIPWSGFQSALNALSSQSR
jgi:hypothetical protein